MFRRPASDYCFLFNLTYLTSKLNCQGQWDAQWVKVLDAQDCLLNILCLAILILEFSVYSWLLREQCILFLLNISWAYYLVMHIFPLVFDKYNITAGLNLLFEDVRFIYIVCKVGWLSNHCTHRAITNPHSCLSSTPAQGTYRNLNQSPQTRSDHWFMTESHWVVLPGRLHKYRVSAHHSQLASWPSVHV